MSVLIGGLALLIVAVLLIGVPLGLGRVLADRDRALEQDDRREIEAEALSLMVGQPVVVDESDAPKAGAEAGASEAESDSGAEQDSSPM